MKKQLMFLIAVTFIFNCGTFSVVSGSKLVYSTATLSEARTKIVATTVGNKAMFAGGAGSDYSDVVDIYDAKENQWYTTTLSQGRQAIQATTVGNKAIFAGGKYGAGASVSDVVDIYDANTNQWSTAALSESRYNHSGTSVGNKAIFMGGRYDGVNYSYVREFYDADTDQWSSAFFPKTRSILTATSVGNKAIFVGGWFYASSNLVEIYDTDLGEPNDPNAWSTSTLSQARERLSATTVGNKAMFAGGEFLDGVRKDSNAVDIYDASLGEPNDPNAWSTATLSQARHSLAATTVGNKAIFAGGNTQENIKSNVVDIYDADLGEPNDPNAWSTATLSQARHSLAATTVRNKAIFAGGNTQENIASNVVDIFILCKYELAGDMNNDCKVDFLDFAMMAANWLIDCGITPDNPACIPK